MWDERVLKPRFIEFLPAALAGFAFSTAAIAHPGHGESGLHGGFLHAWLGWEPALALLVVVLVAWRWIRRR